MMAKLAAEIPEDSSLSIKKTFRVPMPDTALEFTGERLTTLTQGEILHEHLHRYFFALQFCAGKKVLDIASGEGYGSALLASVASEVYGVDIAAEAVQHAAANYSADNLTFLRGDARRIPVPTGSMEVVVSFETLEHLGEQEEFLREIKRVLHPGGLLVMSTPDREFFAASPPNPFHVKELGRAEFEGLIGEHFKNSRFFVQSSLTGSLIVPDRGGGSYEGFRHVHNNLYESAPGLPAAMYMVGVASDGALPEAHAGSFDDREFQLGLYAELQRRHIEILHRDADVDSLRGENSAAAAREAQLAIELTQIREDLVRREQEAESLRQAHDAARERASKAESESGLSQMENIRLKSDLEKAQDAAREQAIKAEAELGLSQGESSRLKRDLEAVQAEGLRSSKQLSLVQSEAARLRDEKSVFQAEAETLRKENADLRERISEVEANLWRSNDELRSFQAETERLKNQIAALESQSRLEVRQLRDQHARLEAESTAAAASLTAQRDASRQKAAELREEVDAVKGSLSWMASAPLRWIGMPAAKIHASAMKAMYGTAAFAYTGKPLARLLSRVEIPGARWLLPKNPLFDAPFYTLRYPDAAAGSKNPWAHYLACGCDESRDPHPQFKTAYYLTHNRDVAAAGVNPLIHYFEHGAREGRDPSPDFDTSYYLEHYPDVGASGLNPLIHFAMHGKAEGRAGRAVRPVPASQPVRVPVAALEEPLISVLMPTFNTPARYLRLAIESVLRQTYEGWQLCIYDDGSSLPETFEVLNEYRGREPRIRIEFGDRNRGIATATNAAIALAQGQYITMLDHDDEIVAEALMEVANVLNGDPGIDALYTDQAYIEADGSPGEPFYKPDWSPEMFRGVMFVGHLLVVRRSLAVELGGFDARFDRVQDFEFMLRVSEKSGKIHHLPKILYFWRRIPGSVAFHGDEKGPIEPIQASAVNAHLKRMRIPAVAEPHPALAHRLTIKPAPRARTPSVQIIETYSNFKAEAEYLLWIDPGLEVLTPDWIEHLLLYCEQPQIACAAPLIVNPDGTVWHSGLVLGMNGIVGYPMQGWRADSDGYAGSLSCAREVSCVSGECLMISRQKLEASGGLVAYYQDSLYAGADLSLRACTAGFRNIVTPRVILRRSRPTDGSPLDRALFADRWGGIAKYGDRCYNPNFSLTSPGYELKKMAAAV